MDPERVIAWLARSAFKPAHGEHELRREGVTLVALGSNFSAVRMPWQLVSAGLQISTPAEAKSAMSRLNGAIICDHRKPAGPSYYALVPSGLDWHLDHLAKYLDRDVYLPVPAPHRTEPPSTHWATPPRYEDDLCDSSAIEQMLITGACAVRAREAAEPSVRWP
ncbi:MULTISPECIES: hypothetical protein [Streptomyces]|uniref:Uncharacterized protein n=1 Tax=Streptomyces doudnae TaxID=3075536 RepID=A0ABD5EMI1_9ACTN|nr:MULTISPECIES: hypothetical protein [unclassified Streptomyces]MDT0435589.1 hypothetical protein [Streptomyces sp. DSM 41981]MYQ62545.1 hypothetical protein [Streptomyces sp. SID4950]SCD39706.1 hypothetical protein GA0115242_104848 [Streptomyces sp. SolWspMP-5a-2]